MGLEKLSNLELCNAFSDFSPAELINYKFISSFIFNHCGLSLNKKLIMNCENRSKLNCWGGSRSKQYPDELAKLLVFIYKNRSNISSYCEIGVERGGTFFIIDSFLRSVNPRMGHSLGIDIKIPDRRKVRFDSYVKRYPNVRYEIINSGNFKPLQKYDLCFIDGDHSYRAVKRDFILMSPFSKYLALHDIKFRETGCEVVDFWDELSGNKLEFLNEDNLFPVPVGIGMWTK